ncbi:hypothetical protein R1flu_020178 [Riccia fluitans]|uniref:Uncharacterized protein n=1 Tax=Riccia fluitans TaxID=41844 RepID=A0ABD1ZKS0_9MARC
MSAATEETTGKRRASRVVPDNRWTERHSAATYSAELVTGRRFHLRNQRKKKGQRKVYRQDAVAVVSTTNTNDHRSSSFLRQVPTFCWLSIERYVLAVNVKGGLGSRRAGYGASGGIRDYSIFLGRGVDFFPWRSRIKEETGWRRAGMESSMEVPG